MFTLDYGSNIPVFASLKIINLKENKYQHLIYTQAA